MGAAFFSATSVIKGIVVNQSKFHFGHEFGALGLLCATPTDWLFFPVWVQAVVPQTLRDKSDAVLETYLFKDPPRPYHL